MAVGLCAAAFGPRPGAHAARADGAGGDGEVRVGRTTLPPFAALPRLRGEDFDELHDPEGLELRWSKLALQTPGFSLLEHDAFALPRPALLGETDPDTGYAFGEVSPFANMGGALMSIVTAGVPLSFETYRERPLCRHFMRVYFRGRGAMVSWRMQF